jgi:hypothetical protein
MTKSVSEHKAIRAASARYARFFSTRNWAEAAEAKAQMYRAQAALMRRKADRLDADADNLTAESVMPA